MIIQGGRTRISFQFGPNIWLWWNMIKYYIITLHCTICTNDRVPSNSFYKDKETQFVLP